jgi:hypothetical protein
MRHGSNGPCGCNATLAVLPLSVPYPPWWGRDLETSSTPKNFTLVITRSSESPAMQASVTSGSSIVLFPDRSTILDNALKRKRQPSRFDNW